jgi:putative transposon-encoded protein
MMKIELNAYDTREKTVKPSGSSGAIYLPPDWIGKRVKVLLIEPLDGD